MATGIIKNTSNPLKGKHNVDLIGIWGTNTIYNGKYMTFTGDFRGVTVTLNHAYYYNPRGSASPLTELTGATVSINSDFQLVATTTNDEAILKTGLINVDFD